MIIRGGENIAPAAVERALMTIPGVTEAVVFGVPHADLGEEVMAVVVVEGDLTAEQIEARCARNGGLVRGAEPLACAERTAADQRYRQSRQARHQRGSPRRAGAEASRERELTMDMQSFQHITPPLRLFHGPDSLRQLGRELERVGSARAVIFCGASLAREGTLLQRVQAAMGERCAGVYAGVRAHSPVPCGAGMPQQS